MSVAKKPTLVSVEEYLAAESGGLVKHEYLGGTVHAMAGGSNRHNDIAGNAFASLHAQLRGTPCRPSNSDTKIRIDIRGTTRFYYPDASVSCDRNPEDESWQDKPVVVLEVLSKSTRRVDLTEKLDAYLSIPSLRVYLLVEQREPAVEVYRWQNGGIWDKEYYVSVGDVVPLPEIEAGLALGEIYAGVDFPESVSLG